MKINNPKRVSDQSTLIIGGRVSSVAANTTYKHALKDPSLSIQSTVIFENTGNLASDLLAVEPSNLVNVLSYSFKLFPISLFFDLKYSFRVPLYVTLCSVQSL